MSRPLQFPAVPVARRRGRPRKVMAPSTASARFAPIRLSDPIDPRGESAPLAIVLELLFPDGLTLRVAPGVDPAALERLVVHLRRRVD